MTDAIAKLSAALADRYRIERELGGGGMATVYLAELRVNEGRGRSSDRLARFLD